MSLSAYETKAPEQVAQDNLHGAPAPEQNSVSAERPDPFIRPPSVPQTTKSSVQKALSFSVNFGPSRKDVLNFTNQLAVMVKAGISIDDALTSIAEQTEKQKFRLAINGINNDVKSGQSFSQALGKYPEIFSSLYVNMIAAAEISGSLSSMLEKLADYGMGERILSY